MIIWDSTHNDTDHMEIGACDEKDKLTRPSCLSPMGVQKSLMWVEIEHGSTTTLLFLAAFMGCPSFLQEMKKKDLLACYLTVRRCLKAGPMVQNFTLALEKRYQMLDICRRKIVISTSLNLRAFQRVTNDCRTLQAIRLEGGISGRLKPFDRELFYFSLKWH